MLTRSMVIVICFWLFSLPVSTAQETPFAPSDLKFLGLDFDFERGSFMATYKNLDESQMTIRIVGPRNPDKIAKVRIEKSELVGKSLESIRLSRTQCRDFVFGRLSDGAELTRIERDFLTVLLVQSERVAPIRHFGMGGYAKIKEGKWEAVFRDPKKKAIGQAFGDVKGQ